MRMIATWLSVPLGFLLAMQFPASAAPVPAEDVPVECQIDLSVFPEGNPAGFSGLAYDEFTGSTYVADTGVLHCPGSQAGDVLKLNCFEQLSGWAFGRLSTKDFRCELTDAECPGVDTPNTADADNKSLTIEADGSVELFCQRNVVQ